MEMQKRIRPPFVPAVYCAGFFLLTGSAAAAPHWNQLPPDLAQRIQAFHRDFEGRNAVKVVRYAVPGFHADLNGTRYSSRDEASKDLPQYFETSPDLKLTIDTLTVLSRGGNLFAVRFGGSIRYVKDVPPDVGYVDETWTKDSNNTWMLTQVVFKTTAHK